MVNLDLTYPFFPVPDQASQKKSRMCKKGVRQSLGQAKFRIPGVFLVVN